MQRAIEPRVGPELNDDQTPFPVDRIDIEVIGFEPYSSKLSKIQHRIRRRPVAIAQLFQHRRQLVFGPRRGDLAIHHEALIHVLDVTWVNFEIDPEIYSC